MKVILRGRMIMKMMNDENNFGKAVEWGDEKSEALDLVCSKRPRVAKGGCEVRGTLPFPRHRTTVSDAVINHSIQRMLSKIELQKKQLPSTVLKYLYSILFFWLSRFLILSLLRAEIVTKLHQLCSFASIVGLMVVEAMKAKNAEERFLL